MHSGVRAALAAAIAAVAALTGATAGAQATAPAPVRLAFINSQKILAEAPGRAEAEATYDREMGAVRGQLQRMDDSLKALVAQYEKDAPGLDSARRVVRGQSIQAREDEYSRRAQQLNQQMQNRQAELARPLMEQVSRVLEEIRQQGGYAMIFDVGSPSSVLVSADKSLDITDRVLARLKQLGAPRAAAPSTPAPARPVQQPAGVRRP